MQLAVIGVSHKQLSLEERGVFSFTDTKQLEFSGLLLNEGIEQCVILSTCNRSEVYVMYEQDIDFLKPLYLNYFHQPQSPCYFKKGEEALRHLLKVTCGLESMLVREDQILGQVKRALEFSKSMQLGGKEIYFLFQETINFVKKIKTEYVQPSLSLTHLAITELNEQFDLSDKKILICGAGEISRSFVPYLYKTNTLIFANRTKANLDDLLEEFPDIQIIPFENRKVILPEIDILISATASPHVIFEAKDLDPYPIYAVDLALPKDIDKDTIVPCIDLESLEERIHMNNQLRTQDEQKILDAIEEMITYLSDKLDSIKNDYMIQSLQKKSLEIADQTYQLLSRKLSLSKKDEYVLEKTLRAAFMQVMKEPIHFIKNGQIDDVAIIHKLFDIKEDIK